jgi:hypothetical protein
MSFNVVSMIAYKKQMELIEYYNSRMITAINNYNLSESSYDYNEYLYYKNELMKVNLELVDILAGM